MATKNEIKKLLKEINYTENQMDLFWNDLIDINSLVKAVSKAGKTWRDMNTYMIRELPTQKKKDLESAEKEKQEKEYYINNFEEVMVEKIVNKEKLTGKELGSLVYDYEECRNEGDDRRWSRSIISYIKLLDRYFCVAWEQGLTECQENEFYNQPYEVEKKVYEKIVPEHKETIVEWIKI